MTKSLLTATVCALLSAGCASDPYAGRIALSRTEIGGRVGSVLGSGASDLFGDGLENTAFGRLDYAIDGGAVIAYMDHQQQEMEEVLQGTDIKVRRTAENALDLSMPDRFLAFDSADLTSETQAMLDSVAKVLNLYPDTTVNVNEYRVDTGSERFAAGVAAYLAQHGVAYSRLKKQGRGQISPKPANGSEVNRRLEIVIVANRKAGALPSSYSTSQPGYLPPSYNNPR